MTRFYPRNIQSRAAGVSRGELHGWGGGEQSINDGLAYEISKRSYGPALFQGGTMVFCGDINVNETKVHSGSWDVFIRYNHAHDGFATLTANIRSIVYASVNSTIASSYGANSQIMSLSAVNSNMLRLNFSAGSGYGVSADTAVPLTLPAALFRNRSLDLDTRSAWSVINSV